jgi:hypothetical protein
VGVGQGHRAGHGRGLAKTGGEAKRKLVPGTIQSHFRTHRRVHYSANWADFPAAVNRGWLVAWGRLDC